MEVDWHSVYKKGQPTTHLQYIWVELLKDWAVVWHCFRHGRITELRKMYHWHEDTLQQFGRWRSRSSMLIYLH